MKTGWSKIGAYRLAIDGTMILSLLIMAWKISAAYTVVETTGKLNRNSISINSTKITALEERLPDIPITKEADRRLTTLETTVQIQYPEIARRLDSIEMQLRNK